MLWTFSISQKVTHLKMQHILVYYVVLTTLLFCAISFEYWWVMWLGTHDFRNLNSSNSETMMRATSTIKSLRKRWLSDGEGTKVSTSRLLTRHCGLLSSKWPVAIRSWMAIVWKKWWVWLGLSTRMSLTLTVKSRLSPTNFQLSWDWSPSVGVN